VSENFLSKISEHVEKLVSLTDSERDMIISLWHVRKVKKKQFLLRVGEVCRFEFFVVKGCYKTYYLDAGGKEHIIRFNTENHLAGDLYSFLSGTPSLYNVEALEDGEVLQLDKTSRERLMQEVPAYEKYFRIKLEMAFASQQSRIIDNFSMSAAERYSGFIDKYPTLEQRISQNQVAAYLGITPQFLSQIRNKIAGKKNGKKKPVE
jgi:CRP-like cAMP-binding protein